MLDPKRIINDKDTIATGVARKGYNKEVVDILYSNLIEIRNLKAELDELRKERNIVQRDSTVSVDKKREMRETISEHERALGLLEHDTNIMLLDVPNIPDEDAPDGGSEEDNVVVCECDDFYNAGLDNYKPHWELGKALNIIDTQLASKISGSMSAVYIGKGSKLLRALISFALNLHSDKYLEITPPHMVTSQTLTYTGHLPKFADDQYTMKNDDLWLIPTAEVPLTGMFSNCIFSKDDLPQYRMGYSVCFRREAGSAGKDTRGLQRLHEFHKVELVKICTPEQKDAELKDLLNDCLEIIKLLKLQYRVVDLCTGDMGDKYGRCFDIEVYSPGVGKWLEVSSVGHFSDYQARRAGIKYKDENGKNKVAYTMNGSGMATPRVIAAIIETYQNEDGTITVPDVLVPFMGCSIID